MKRSLLFFSFALLVHLNVFSQTKMRDIFSAAPDSIFPLLTENNRLDCIDFIENSMEARVKNRLEGNSELKSLTSDYLYMQVTAKSTVEMRLLSDSLFCLIQTYYGPAADSHIRFYDTLWNPVELEFSIPSVEEFWKPVPDSLKQEVAFVQRSLQDLFLLQISVSKEKNEFTFTLQTSELPTEEKEIAQQYVQPLIYKWNGQRLVR